MSAQGYGTDITLIAAADLSAKQYFMVKVDSAGKAALAGAGDFCIGVLQNKPEAGQPATVRILGKTKVIAGGSLSAGAKLAADANGKAKAAVAGKTDTSDTGGAADALIGSNVVGIACEDSGADLQVVSMILVHAGAVPTTAA